MDGNLGIIQWLKKSLCYKTNVNGQVFLSGRFIIVTWLKLDPVKLLLTGTYKYAFMYIEYCFLCIIRKRTEYSRYIYNAVAPGVINEVR